MEEFLHQFAARAPPEYAPAGFLSQSFKGGESGTQQPRSSWSSNADYNAARCQSQEAPEKALFEQEQVFEWQGGAEYHSPGYIVPPRQRPKAIPELGLFIFDDARTVYVLDVTKAKAKLRMTVVAQFLLQGWETFDGHLYIVDGTLVNCYDITLGEPTREAVLDLHEAINGPGSSQALNIGMLVSWQRRHWAALATVLLTNLVSLLMSPLPAGSPPWQLDGRAGWQQFGPIFTKVSQDFWDHWPLGPIPLLPVPNPPPVTRADLKGDLSCQYLLAALDVCHLLGYSHRPGLDAPTLCAYMVDHPVEIFIFLMYTLYIQKSVIGPLRGNVQVIEALEAQRADALLMSSSAAGFATGFSAPVFRENAESSPAGMYVLRSDGVVLGVRMDLQSGAVPRVVQQFPSASSQAVVLSGLLLDETADTVFYISKDKGLCSVPLHQAAPQSYPSPQAPGPATFAYSVQQSYLQRMPPLMRTPSRLLACLPSMCAFAAGNAGGNAPLARTLFPPVSPGWQRDYNYLEADDQTGLLLTVDDLGTAEVYSTGAEGSPPRKLLELKYPLADVNSRSRVWSAALVLPPHVEDGLELPATSARIPLPAVLLTDVQYVEEGLGEYHGKTLLSISGLPSSEAGTPTKPPERTPLGSIGGTACSGLIVHYNVRARQLEAVVFWKRDGPDAFPVEVLAPALGSESLGTSAWGRYMEGRPPEQLLLGPPPVLLQVSPNLTSVAIT